MFLSAVKSSEYEIGNTIGVALWQTNHFFLSITTHTCKKKILQFLIKTKATNSDEDEIRTHAGKPQWISSPSP